MDEIRLPWAKDTPQKKGRREEKTILKARGYRPHPGSGSGSIPFDGSDENDLVEVKDAAKSFTFNLNYIDRFYKTAVRQGKRPVFILQIGPYLINMNIERRTGT